MTASGPHEQAAHVFEDTALSFSDEEWLGLAMWQRELYWTVMRDTMELVTSLGYMFLRREESEQRDCAETEETAVEDIIHIPETAGTLEKAPSSGEPFSPYSETSAPPIALPHFKTIQKKLRDPFTNEQPPSTEAQKTLGEKKPDSPNPETSFIHEVKPENKDGAPITWQRTGDFIRRLEDASSPYVGFGSSLCGSSADLFNERDQQGTQDLLEDAEFLTVIKVEEINVAIESEVTSLHRWESHPEHRNGEEHWELQEGASTDPHNNYYLPWTVNQGVLSPGTLQWTEQSPSSSGQCVEEGGVWLTTPEYPENFYKCSMCSRSFGQSPYHERLQVEKGASCCPTCYSHLLSDQHVQDHHPPFLRESTPQASQDKPSFTCPKCERSFSQLAGLHRHMKSHTRNKTPVKVMAPPLRKVYNRPILPATQRRETRSTAQYSREAYSKLHQHLQLSTAFLRQLITSTGGFQYD